jgi:hypothetical protein
MTDTIERIGFQGSMDNLLTMAEQMSYIARAGMEAGDDTLRTLFLQRIQIQDNVDRERTAHAAILARLQREYENAVDSECLNFSAFIGQSQISMDQLDESVASIVGSVSLPPLRLTEKKTEVRQRRRFLGFLRTRPA